MALEREFKVQPAAEGRHGTRFLWLLKGPDLVVQFLLRMDHEGKLEPWDLGFHCSFDPGWSTEMDDCDVLPGGKCWYDGSSLNADPVFDRLCREGLDGLWAELEDYYDGLFKSFAEERLAGRTG
jgi:hypothetical protein